MHNDIAVALEVASRVAQGDVPDSRDSEQVRESVNEHGDGDVSRVLPADVDGKRAVDENKSADHDKASEDDLNNIAMLVLQVVFISGILLGLVSKNLSCSCRVVSHGESKHLGFTAQNSRVGETNALRID